MIRLIHFSDIHITAQPLGWQVHDWFNKRLPGWLNLKWLGRELRFRRAEQVLAVLAADIRARQPDRVIFSGDATALGFDAEFRNAASMLGLSDAGLPPGLAVPGNHDYYTKEAADARLFERYFAPWQTGERVDGETYPFVQRVGDAWLVAVNSSTANRWAWDASGAVGKPQLERLAALLSGLDSGPRILVTHYPIALANGKRERKSHGLRDLADVLDVASRGGIGLWLHGHRHGAYHHPFAGSATFPNICAGSATQSGKWSYTEYTLDGRQLQCLRRVFDRKTSSFRDGESFSLELPAY
jgi:3',5'-cyclic AMP phosphodiesterase CpdA